MNGSLQGEMLEALPSSGSARYMYLAMLLSAILVTAILISNMEKREQENVVVMWNSGMLPPLPPIGCIPSGRLSL